MGVKTSETAQYRNGSLPKRPKRPSTETAHFQNARNGPVQKRLTSKTAETAQYRNGSLPKRPSTETAHFQNGPYPKRSTFIEIFENN